MMLETKIGTWYDDDKTELKKTPEPKESDPSVFDKICNHKLDQYKLKLDSEPEDLEIVSRDWSHFYQDEPDMEKMISYFNFWLNKHPEDSTVREFRACAYIELGIMD